MDIKQIGASLVGSAAGYYIGTQIAKLNKNSYAKYFAPVSAVLGFLIVYKAYAASTAPAASTTYTNAAGGAISPAPGYNTSVYAGKVISPAVLNIPDGTYNAGWAGDMLYIDIP